MAARGKTHSNRTVRHSVALPAEIASEVRRIAQEHHLTMSRALLTLVERGVRADAEAKARLESAYIRFTNAPAEAADKSEAGRELICAIFGDDAVAEDPVL